MTLCVPGFMLSAAGTSSLAALEAAVGLKQPWNEDYAITRNALKRYGVIRLTHFIALQELNLGPAAVLSLATMLFIVQAELPLNLKDAVLAAEKRYQYLEPEDATPEQIKTRRDEVWFYVKKITLEGKPTPSVLASSAFMSRRAMLFAQDHVKPALRL